MIDEAFLAPCGRYCGICGIYYATRDDNFKFLGKLLRFYQSAIAGIDHLTIEDLKRRGCLSDQISFFCRICAIKKCTRRKDIAGCQQCGEFPCTHIENFPVPVGKKVILVQFPIGGIMGRSNGWPRRSFDMSALPAGISYSAGRSVAKSAGGAWNSTDASAAIDENKTKNRRPEWLINRIS